VRSRSMSRGIAATAKLGNPAAEKWYTVAANACKRSDNA
jgi:hypothetical protein